MFGLPIPDRRPRRFRKETLRIRNVPKNNAKKQNPFATSKPNLSRESATSFFPGEVEIFKIDLESLSSPSKKLSNPNNKLFNFFDKLKAPPQTTTPKLESSFEPKKDTKIEVLEKNPETLSDLIGMIRDDDKNYSFDMKGLWKAKPHLEKLDNMVGLCDVKRQILDQILYFSQPLHRGEDMMLHTVIQGPPGVGKTELGKVLSGVYCALGITKNDKMKIVSRGDLVGEYLGHTAHKTQKVINEAMGGVLFIDEAYSLGNRKSLDQYSKECIDTLCMNLSEKKNNFICIIAGYKDSLRDNFFSHNEGLARRFAFRYTIKGYDSDELTKILNKKITDTSWKLKTPLSFCSTQIKENLDLLNNYGGDIEKLFNSIKISHSKRVFGKDVSEQKVITKEDFLNGFDQFKKQKEKKENKFLSLYI